MLSTPTFVSTVYCLCRKKDTCCIKYSTQKDAENVQNFKTFLKWQKEEKTNITIFFDIYDYIHDVWLFKQFN